MAKSWSKNKPQNCRKPAVSTMVRPTVRRTRREVANSITRMKVQMKMTNRARLMFLTSSSVMMSIMIHIV